jgi:hypothetical protein
VIVTMILACAGIAIIVDRMGNFVDSASES